MCLHETLKIKCATFRTFMFIWCSRLIAVQIKFVIIAILISEKCNKNDASFGQFALKAIAYRSLRSAMPFSPLAVTL